MKKSFPGKKKSVEARHFLEETQRPWQTKVCERTVNSSMCQKGGGHCVASAALVPPNFLLRKWQFCQGPPLTPEGVCLRGSWHHSLLGGGKGLVGLGVTPGSLHWLIGEWRHSGKSTRHGGSEECSLFSSSVHC